MPHHKSAVKRMRTSKKAQQKNASVKSEIRTYLKKMQEDPANTEVAGRPLPSWTGRCGRA
jgi:ribosomal protein S20